MRKKFTLALLSLLLVPLGMMAQDVTIRANNGACIAAVKTGGTTDAFFNIGGFATWQHEQLNMVLTVSDGTALTPNGQLDNPANNLFKASDGVHMQIGKGAGGDATVCYATVSLPSGYRFTGYLIEFTKPSGVGNSFNGNNQQSTFGETNSTFGTYTTQATITTGGAQQTIQREGSAANPMSNVLYFKLQNPESSRALIQLENAKFFFTAEDNFTSMTPAEQITTPVSAVNVPFSTSKVDFGTIANRNYNGAWRVSYDSQNVTDIAANFILYEAESTKTGTDVDGGSGLVVDFKEGNQYTITSAGGYFKLGKGASSTDEQIYYIETPTSVTISDNENHKVPIGYRITGAEIEYATNVSTRTFRITYTTTGMFSSTYYLNANGRFTTTSVYWEMDNEGYISTGSGASRKYLYFNNGYAATQSQKPAESERFGIDSNNNIYQLQWPTYFITYYSTGGYNATRYGMISNTTGQKASVSNLSTQSGSVGNFTLKVYDMNGANPKTINVTGTGTEPITGLNNDAIKFGVIGQGLIRASITLQALDPYLDQMSVWCHDLTEPAIKLQQTFHASDFSVSGGEFDFYLPSDCINDEVQITFEDLNSQYFDNTYDEYVAATGPHYSRINFVKSQHYNAFGLSNNNIYTNTTEAASGTLESTRIAANNGAGSMVRTKVSTVGSAPFKFNNADEVGTSGGTVSEYAFSLENYAGAPNKGSFGDMKFTVKAQTQTDTRYVFTTDETRYNIAPTTATQHRAYAFYTMKVNIHSSTYQPKVKFTKIYNQTLYGTGQTDAFYGVDITTTAPASVGAGYASTDEVFAVIDAAVKGNTATGTLTKTENGQTRTIGSWEGWDASLKSAKQLLYIDFSKLDGVYQRTTDEHQSMEDYGATNAANCLIFVPAGAGALVNNVAEKVGANSYRATHNFVLTDKEPFYTPYDIQVPSGKTMSYQRKITTDMNGKVQNASLILPFEIALEGGKHTNTDGTSFSLHTMQSGQTLTIKDDQLVAYFPALNNNVTTAAANTPYLVKLDGNSSAEGVTFTISQPGSLITKTTGMASDYTFSGVAVTEVKAGGTSAGAGTFTLTPKGTYAGQQVPKGENIFYFAKNVFVNSKDYMYDKVNVAPFRAFFATPDANAKFASFMPVFEEVDGDVTAIAPVEAFIDVEAPVYDLQGRMVATSYREAKSLKRGMYVVNGVKIIVK